MKWPEKLLHFIWRYKLINQIDLQTTHGDSLRILDFGQYNTHAGADFEYAKIQINDRIWVGNIELHLSSIDWKHHKHNLDPRYNSTILHVVWEDSANSHITRLDGTVIPTLVLQNYVDHTLLYKYQQLMENEQWIACENQMYKVSEITIMNWLDRLVIERLETRMELILSWAKSTSNDWEKVMLVALSRAFGMKVNSNAFECLMSQMSVNHLRKYANDPFKLEALLFCNAGFLTNHTSEEDYVVNLREEYLYLKHLHGLFNLSTVEWKFLRMRPYNFLTFRLAQFCGLLVKHISWFDFVKNGSLEVVMKDLISIEVSKYWNVHFHFNKNAKPHETQLTKEFIQHIVLNAFVPVLFTYAKHTGNHELQQKAIEWLQQLPVEKNAIIKAYKQLNINANSASESQAL